MRSARIIFAFAVFAVAALGVDVYLGAFGGAGTWSGSGVDRYWTPGGGGIECLYSNPGGSGNRTNDIAITSSNIDWVSVALVPTLVDGTPANGALYWADDGGAYSDPNAGAWIMFDFGVGAQKVIQEVRWIQSAAQTNGIWKWQGSDNGADFTDLCASNAFSGADATNIWSEMSANTTGYRYYRMLGLSGEHSGNKYQRQVEFKIDDE